MEAWWVNSKIAYSDWSDLSANQRDFFYHAGFFVFKADVLGTSRRILYTRMKFVGGETKTIDRRGFRGFISKVGFFNTYIYGHLLFWCGPPKTEVIRKRVIATRA